MKHISRRPPRVKFETGPESRRAAHLSERDRLSSHRLPERYSEVIPLQPLPLSPSDMSCERHQPVVRQLDELARPVEKPRPRLLLEVDQKVGDGKEQRRFPVDGSVAAEEVDQPVFDEGFVAAGERGENVRRGKGESSFE